MPGWQRAKSPTWADPTGYPTGFRAARFDAGGLGIHVARGPAKGPPLLLLPGLNDLWSDYGAVLPALARRFSVYVVDWRGHGRSDRAPDGRYRVVDYAGDILTLLREGIGEPVFVAGCSLGALVAARVAAMAPDLVRGCVLEDGPFFLTEPARWRAARLRTAAFGDTATRLEAVERDGSGEAAFVRAQGGRRWSFVPDIDLPGRARYLAKLTTLLGPAWSAASARERSRLGRGYAAFLTGKTVTWRDMLPEAMVRDAAAVALRVAAGCSRAAARADFSAGMDHAATLRAIRCSTLVLEADRDLSGLLSEADIGMLMDCLSATRATHRRCEGALHAIHRSHPDLYVEAVASFPLAPSPPEIHP